MLSAADEGDEGVAKVMDLDRWMTMGEGEGVVGELFREE